MPEIEQDKIVIKPLEFNKLLVFLERLTRFEHPYNKRSRVYKEILTKNTISPKISLKNYYDYSLKTRNFLAQLIWDLSVKDWGGNASSDYGINIYLAYEEIKTFSPQSILENIIFSENLIKFTKPGNSISSNKEFQIISILNEIGINIASLNPDMAGLDVLSRAYLLYTAESPLNIDGLLTLIEQNNNGNLKISENISRLIRINNFAKHNKLNISGENFAQTLDFVFRHSEKLRKEKAFKYPAKMLVIAEGITEEKLLPIFSDKLGLNFEKNGIHLIAAGGKNQVARIYDNYRENLRLPVLILLDADAVEVIDKIKEVLCDKDRIFVISKGEFEDILPVGLICKSINAFYGLTANVIPQEIQTGESMSASLNKIWKEKGFGDFNKAKFAQIIAENITDEDDISPVIRQICLIIKDMLNY